MAKKAAPKREWVWMRVRQLRPDEKAAIAASCDQFIAEVLKPRFLPEITPTKFNYPVNILGWWRGSKYSFILRLRSGFEHNTGEEFDEPWVRLDHDETHLEDIRFAIMRRRYTGQWFLLHRLQTLAESLNLIGSDPFLQPPT